MNPIDAANQMLIDSDFPLDKLIYLKQSSTTIAAGGSVPIAHLLPFTPLPYLQWSLTPDFSVVYENNSGNYPSGNPGYTFGLQVSIEANSANITLSANGIAGSTVIYYRIFGFMPDDVDVATLATVSLGDSFVFNTDFNYLKLYLAGHQLVNGGTDFPISHPIGRRPRVRAWISYNGVIQPLSYSDPDGYQVETTATSVILHNYGFLNATFYYRIYLDA